MCVINVYGLVLLIVVVVEVVIRGMNKVVSLPHVHYVLQLHSQDWGQGDGAGWVSACLRQEVHGTSMLPTALGTSVPS